MTQDALTLALNDAGPEVRLEAIREVAEDPMVTLSERLSMRWWRRRRRSQSHPAPRRRGARRTGIARRSRHREIARDRSRMRIRARDGARRMRSAWSLWKAHSISPRCPRSSRPSRAATATCAGRRPNSSCASEKNYRDAVSNRLIELAGTGNLNARKMALYCLRDVGGPREELLAVAESCCGDHLSRFSRWRRCH